MPLAKALHLSFDDSFHRHPIEAKGKTLIHTVCKKCGDSRLLSFSDGSLVEWESHHDCNTATGVARLRFLA